MATTRKTTAAPEDHAFRRFGRMLKDDSLPAVMAMYGQEDYLIRWALGQLKKKYVNPATEVFNYSVFDSLSSSTQDIIHTCETMPMMAEKRLVIVKNIPSLGGKAGRGTSGGNEGEGGNAGTGPAPSETGGFDETVLLDYLEEISSDCLLVLTGPGSPDKRRKAFKQIGAQGGLLEFSPLDKKEFTAFVRKRLKMTGHQFGNEIVQAIMDNTGYFDRDSTYRLDNLVNDLNKLGAYAEGPEITMGDLQETLAGNMLTDTFVFLDNLCEGKKGEAYVLLKNILDGNPDGGVFLLLGSICSHFELLLKVKEMMSDGWSYQDMVKLLKVHEFRVKKAMGTSRRFTQDALKRILMSAYGVERDVKSGTLEPAMALELFVAGV